MSFTATPPNTIALSGGAFSGYYGVQGTPTTSYVKYKLYNSNGTQYGSGFSAIYFHIVSGNLELNVQDPNDNDTTYEPYTYAAAGTQNFVASGQVTAGNGYDLFNGGTHMGRITCPTELAVASSTVHRTGTFVPPATIYCTDTTHAQYPSHASGYLFARDTSNDVTVGGVITKYAYVLGETTVPQGYANHVIHLDTATNTWVDGHATNEPDPIEHVPGAYWVRWRHGHQSSNVWYYFEDKSSWYSAAGSGSGSGSGGGIQTLSGGTSPEIINVQFTKLSDDSLQVSFDYQNISHFTMFRQWPSGTAPYNVWSNMGGVGSSGSWSGGGSFLQSLSEDTKVWVVGSTDADGNMPVYTHRIIDWEIDTTTTPHSMKAKAFFENNGGNGFGFNADVGLHACGPNLSTGCGIKDTQIYDGNLQDMSSELVWGTLYKVLKPDNTQYGRAYQYGKTSKSGKVSSNFW